MFESILAFLSSDLAAKLGIEFVKVLVTAGLITPLVAFFVNWNNARRWRPFRAYVGRLLKRNHDELKDGLYRLADISTKLSRMDSEDIQKDPPPDLSKMGASIVGHFARIEDIVFRSHFALSPNLMWKWQSYHSYSVDNLAPLITGLEIRLADFMRKIESSKAGEHPSSWQMYDDVFAGPIGMMADEIKKIDFKKWDATLETFLHDI